MIISAKIVKPRKGRKCLTCGKAIVGKALRLYGSCDSREKPYVIWLHPGCTCCRDPKIVKAQESLKQGATHA
jgi:hypothetical protein